MKVPSKYNEQFKEYIAIRILDKISHSDFIKMRSTLEEATDVNSLYNYIFKKFPNLKDEFASYESDFLNEIKNGKE
jgi:hypothetical protein